MDGTKAKEDEGGTDMFPKEISRSSDRFFE
jgi:hypothetical protein